ncbi:hypothetical protein CHS0354_041319 [Potamilus streckersoni]|uniref:Uncharacterized protein n=1 Tax=Potamilus streckersoni TaxID=2493646 RepID=A0AAE0SFA5_9BIVA|nr:hypothetical protein CHS0354_041319 [Potamilus streckersoni]
MRYADTNSWKKLVKECTRRHKSLEMRVKCFQCKLSIRCFGFWLCVFLLMVVSLNNFQCKDPTCDERKHTLDWSSRDIDLLMHINNFKVIQTIPFKFIKGSQGRYVREVNCKAIINGEHSEILHAEKLSPSHRPIVPDTNFSVIASNCDDFKQGRGYLDYHVTKEEKEFPISFSILMYKDVEQAERLLRAIYRPQNLYCIHVDLKAEPVVHSGIDAIASCFDNVFVVSKKESVVYAGFTRLQADLNCMKDLLEKGKLWKYFINLPSQQFPLKTNFELVKILNSFNGTNNIEGIIGPRRLDFRFKYHYKYVSGSNMKPKLVRTTKAKPPPPFNISIVKGSAYGVFSRNFVEFILTDRKAVAFLDWTRDIYSPDEYYWATLNYNTHIGAPGSYSGHPDEKKFLAVYAEWGKECYGKYVRSVCIFGLRDLKRLLKRKELFANKFYLAYQPYTYDCIEEWLYNKSMNIDIWI